MTNVETRPSISFEKWKFSIQTSTDLPQLMLVVSGYLSMWSTEELQHLPPEIVGPITSSEELMVRAVDASRAEVHFTGPELPHRLLREMATTLAFAASRMRYLQALRANGT